MTLTSSTPEGPRVVVITGASAGIGRATAIAFAGRGDQVVVAARKPGPLREVVAECERAGGSALDVPTDVSDEGQVQRLAQRAAEHFGRIDVWVNAAAVIVYGEFEEIPSEVYDHVLQTNLHGQIYGARAVLPYFRENGGKGVLINIASVWGAVSSPYVSAYVVSKFGVRAFSESLQESMRLHSDTRDIHVCSILPQSVDTPIFSNAGNYTGRQTKPVPPVVDTQRVVRAVLRSVRHPRLQRTVGLWGCLLEVGHSVMPAPFTRLTPPAMKFAALGEAPAPDGPGNVFEPSATQHRVQGNWRNMPARAALVGVAGSALAATAWAGTRAVRSRSLPENMRPATRR